MNNPIIAAAQREGRTLLTEIEAKTLLREAGIPVVETRFAADKKQALALSRELGFPVALKIVSPHVAHKSDVGGVRLDLTTPEAVGQAYDELLATVRERAPEARLDGVAVQQMARPGLEVILGLFTDPQFGPVLMFGLGGVLVEVLKDVSFRVVPLEPWDAQEMIREIKGYPLLQGYRGQEPAHLPTLEAALLGLSAFAEAHPEVKEIDLNPVFAYPDGALAVDARVVLHGKEEPSP